jgi:hypothetical protein
MRSMQRWLEHSFCSARHSTNLIENVFHRHILSKVRELFATIDRCREESLGCVVNEEGKATVSFTFLVELLQQGSKAVPYHQVPDLI